MGCNSCGTRYLELQETGGTPLRHREGTGDQSVGADETLGGFLAEPLALQCRCCRAKDGARLRVNGDNSFRLTVLYPSGQIDQEQQQWLRRSAAVASGEPNRWLHGFYLDEPEEWDDPYRFFRW